MISLRGEEVTLAETGGASGGVKGLLDRGVKELEMRLLVLIATWTKLSRLLSLILWFITCERAFVLERTLLIKLLSTVRMMILVVCRG